MNRRLHYIICFGMAQHGKMKRWTTAVMWHHTIQLDWMMMIMLIYVITMKSTEIYGTSDGPTDGVL